MAIDCDLSFASRGRGRLCLVAAAEPARGRAAAPVARAAGLRAPPLRLAQLAVQRAGPFDPQPGKRADGSHLRGCGAAAPRAAAEAKPRRRVGAGIARRRWRHPRIPKQQHVLRPVSAPMTRK
eukprot:gene2787-biopygen2691